MKCIIYKLASATYYRYIQPDVTISFAAYDCHVSSEPENRYLAGNPLDLLVTVIYTIW